MQSLTAPASSTDPGPHSPPGRWIWRLIGVLTVAGLSCIVALATIRSGQPTAQSKLVSAVPSPTVTISQPVTSVNVTSYGGLIQITRKPAREVTVVEAVRFNTADGPPAVQERVSHGTLTLAAPACASAECMVGFTVTVPTGVAVNASSSGGEVSVSGATTASLDSDGGPINASSVSGALTANAEGGNISVLSVHGSILDSGGGSIEAGQIDGPLTAASGGGDLGVTLLSGPLSADSGGGPVSAINLTGSTSRVTTDGGQASISYSRVPRTVQVTTSAGPADVQLPGGPYTVSADSAGGPQRVTVPAMATAASTVTVSTGGGRLQITPPGPSGRRRISR